MAMSMTVLDWKLISTLIVSGGSMIFGLLPVYFGLGSRFYGSLLNSAFLCFGSGVLMSTSIVHILPETRIFLEGWAEITFCCGFMIIYLIDIIFDLIKQLNTQSENLRAVSYGTIGDDGSSPGSINVAGAPPTLICSNFSLILAFSIHSLLEGLVIGVEPTARGVWVLLLAICCHKLLVAFCLGCELSSEGNPVYKIIPQLFVFAVMSAAGILLGCIIQPDEVSGLEKIVPTLQALAGGTLLYIVMIEILPRERAKTNVLPIFSSIVQYLAVLFGFVLMTVVTTVTGD